jgi:hypothetical protein
MAETTLDRRGVDWAAWFGRAVGLGILANLSIAVPGMFQPNAVLGLLRQPPDLDRPIWAAAASMMLVLVSLFYIPGAIDPYRYKATAILSLVARLSGTLFFLVLWPNQYPFVGYLDLTFLVLEAPLLFLALRQGSHHRPEFAGPGTPSTTNGGPHVADRSRSDGPAIAR